MTRLLKRMLGRRRDNSANEKQRLSKPVIRNKVKRLSHSSHLQQVCVVGSLCNPIYKSTSIFSRNYKVDDFKRSVGEAAINNVFPNLNSKVFIWKKTHNWLNRGPTYRLTSTKIFNTSINYYHFSPFLVKKLSTRVIIVISILALNMQDMKWKMNEILNLCSTYSPLAIILIYVSCVILGEVSCWDYIEESATTAMECVISQNFCLNVSSAQD